MPYKNVDHELICPECGKHYTVKTAAYKRKMNDTKYGMLCTPCRARRQMLDMTQEQREALHQKAIEATKARYQNMSEEERQRMKDARKEGIKKYWSGMTSEEYAAKCKEMSEREILAKSNISDERRKEIGKRISDGKKAAFANMSAEDRNHFIENKRAERKQYWESLSDERKRELVGLMSAGCKKNWESMNPIDKLVRLTRLHNAQQLYYQNLSDNEKSVSLAKMNEGFIKWWKNLSDEDRANRIKNISIASKEYWDSEEARNKRSNASKEYWAQLDNARKYELLQPLYDGRDEFWKSLDPEERYEATAKMRQGYRNFWDNMTNERYIELIESLRSTQKKRWERIPEEEKIEMIRPMREGFRNWWNNLSENDKELYADKMREKVNKYWESPEAFEEQSNMTRERWMNMTARQKFEHIEKMHRGKGEKFKSSAEKEFEDWFNRSILSDDYKLIYDQVFHNITDHGWDYAIYDNDDNLVCVVDIDGQRFHGDGKFEYDGISSFEHLDIYRGLSIPDGINHLIIPADKIDDSIKELQAILSSNHTEFIDRMFAFISKMPFPEPTYSNKIILESWNNLSSMNTDDRYHRSLSMNSRFGDKLIYHFHHSIWYDHVVGKFSPYEVWSNYDMLYDAIINHTVIYSWICKDKLLSGFGMDGTAQRVSVFSAAKAKMIISKYLSEFNEIFDPFSGYSERMLGTISLGKRYIGQDISERHVAESNRMISFLKNNYIKFDAVITKADILQSSGEYECLFACPPSGTESYEDVISNGYSCDDWISECLKRFNCKRYVFVVDETTKYKDCLVEEIFQWLPTPYTKLKLIVIKRSN